ncbi:MAG: class I SAM-dependent methyltransferase [Acidimicrobiales bacterium]
MTDRIDGAAAGILPYTAHNLALPDGSCTIPGQPLLEDLPLSRAVMGTLDLLFPHRGEGSCSVVDLGCLEGGYAALFARAGFATLGIEGRLNNFERCQYTASRSGLTNLAFACDDVHNLARYGSFDAVFCSGILYHLADPVAFLRMAARCTRRCLLLRTHFATDSVPATFPHLSEMTTHEGVAGRWYPEHGEESTDDEIMSRRWASIGNRSSFWIDKRHLLQTLRDVGFAPVYEQYDFLSHVVDDTYIADYHSSLFVAVRSPSP